MENDNKIKNKKLLIKVIIISVVVLSVIGGLFIKGYSSAQKKYENIIAELTDKIKELEDQTVVYVEASSEVDISLINSKIQEIGELATIEYLYTNAGKFEDPKKVFGKNVPFTTKSFIAKWDGIIKAGIDISEVYAEVDKSKKEIIIYVPMAEILSHEIDSESVETLDQKDGLFNPVKVEDVRTFDATSKKAMEQRAIENGILEKAFDNAKGIIEKLVNNEAIKELQYTVTFQIVE